ncbi:MAG: hypothetical protein LBE06_11970 [Azoarcus sp.]|jgi:hypothetical protein|nr:hypothetical protein [Azoarcus sp.]
MTGGAPLITIRLKPDSALLTLALAAHLAAGLALFLMDLPFAAAASLSGLVVLSAVRAARTQARKRGLSLVLAADGGVRVCRAGGENGDDETAWARVLPGAALFPAVLWFTLAWTAMDGRARRLSLMLIAAEVEEDARGDDAQWRRLRTWLNHRAARPARDGASAPGNHRG